MRNFTHAAESLRKKVLKAGSEMARLMNEYELFGVEVIQAPNRAQMDDWLVRDRPRRHAPVPPSPGIDLTHSTDASNLTQQSGEALLSDDYTGSEVSHAGEDSVEERSTSTDTGLPDTQNTDESYSPGEKKRKKKAKKAKKDKRAKKAKTEDDVDESDGSGDSRQY